MSNPMTALPSKQNETTKLRNAVWVVLADKERAKLLRCGLTENGRCHVETSTTIENSWPGHDHPRSSPQWKNATVSYGMEDNDTSEETKRFVHEVTDWLKRRMKAHNIASVVILAPPRFTGVLRKTKFAREHAMNVIQHKGELVNLPTRKLADHAIIRGLVASEKA